jgi:hypothetical protein
MLFINNEAFLELPNEVINEIMKFLSPHPVSKLIMPHINNMKKCCGWGYKYNNFKWFDWAYFDMLRATEHEYNVGLKMALREVEKVKFIREHRLKTGSSYLQAKNYFHHFNNFDCNNLTDDDVSDGVEDVESDGEDVESDGEVESVEHLH